MPIQGGKALAASNRRTVGHGFQGMLPLGGDFEGRHATSSGVAQGRQPLPLAGVNPKGGGPNPLFGEVRRAARCITSLLAFFSLPAG